MYHRENLINLQIEKPFRFDNFQSLIDHRRRVDSNFRTHLPVRMVQGIFDTDRFHLFPGKVTERATACCDNDSLDIVYILPDQTLRSEERRVGTESNAS